MNLRDLIHVLEQYEDSDEVYFKVKTDNPETEVEWMPITQIHQVSLGDKIVIGVQ